METESIGSSVGSFSFANTAPFSFSSEISGLDGGSYNPGLNLSDTILSTKADIGNISLDTKSGKDFCMTSMPQYICDGTKDINFDLDILSNKPTFETLAGIEKSLEGVILDPNLPDYYKFHTPVIPSDPDQIGRVWESTQLVEDCHVSFDYAQDPRNDNFEIRDYKIPQIFKDAFEEDNLLEPQTFLESISKVDLAEIKPQTNIIEQLITSPEPEIDQTEAKIAEIFEEPLTAPKIENLVEEVQESLYSHPGLDPGSNTMDSCFRRNDRVENLPQGYCPLRGGARNDNNELAVTPESQAEIQAQDEDMPEIALPELEQSVQTYNALINAGIEKEQAGVLVEQALIKAGTEPEVAQKVVEQVKTGTRTKNSHAEFISASDKILKPASRQGGQVQNDKKDIGFEEKSADAEAMADKEKKKQLKFVVDEKALAERGSALKMAVEQVPGETGLGDDIIDSNKVVTLMPTEVQNQRVVSGILPKRFIEWLNLGDGVYRLWVASIRALGKLSKWAILKAGLGMNRKFYPVTIDEIGEEAGKEGVALVLEHKPDPIRALRRMVVYN